MSWEKMVLLVGSENTNITVKMYCNGGSFFSAIMDQNDKTSAVWKE